MQFRRLPRFSLRTLFLLISCPAFYLAGYQHGRIAGFSHWNDSLHVTKSFSIPGILPARADKEYWAEKGRLKYFIEESLLSTKKYNDVALPSKVIGGDSDSVSISVPPYRMADVELLLAKLRQLEQIAKSKGESFEIPAPLRDRRQW
ncbi:MAG TPA: hypothetical protein VN699_08640 [Pirellulales bacterium]|nr:hypothetical protein [Pirellulales bacterium]